MNTPSPLEDIFFTALEKTSPAERAAYLDEACAGDSDLRERVERMLAAQANAGSFLEAPPDEIDRTIDQPITEGPGSEIGPFTLLQQIGEGGMGVVYMADQKKPVDRRVALKIIKPGMDTRQFLARFDAEKQALAMMDHPNIARVLDAGETETGRPYIVMELVKGIPIIQYCDGKRLTPRERLELFIPVCHAIQHAHQKGIIHRDIKPSNVLVAEYDERPVPKIIDFGVAKAVNQRLSEKTMFTHFGQVLGTIEYMSPEQAKLNQLDIDTRSDIYSLGVLLYELISGEIPFDRQRLQTVAFDELLRIIREEEPPRPSIRLHSSLSLPSIAANRRTEPKKLGMLVHGELDWIVMKSLEKERARRYETANALALDIQRYLKNDPVSAGPPSNAYRIKKFIKRNRATVLTASLIAGILILGLIGTSTALRWAMGERFRANKTAMELTASNKLLKEQMFLSETKLANSALDNNEIDQVADYVRKYNTPEKKKTARRFAYHFLSNACHQRRPSMTINVSDKVNELVVSGDGKQVFANLLDGLVIGWNAQTGCRTDQFQSHLNNIHNMPLALSYDGRIMAHTGKKISVILLRDLKTEEIIPLDGHQSAVFRVAFSRIGNRVATADMDGKIRIWDTNSGKELLFLDNGAVGFTTVDFSPDGKVLAASTTDTIHLYDCNTGQEINKLRYIDFKPRVLRWKGIWVQWLCFSPDGKYLASAVADGTVRLWDLTAEAPLETVVHAHADSIYALVFLPNSEGFVTGGRDGAIKIWDLQKLKVLETLRGHQGAITAVAVTATGDRLFTAGVDHRILVWDISTPIRKNQYFLDFEPTSLVFTEKDTLIALSQNEPLRMTEFIECNFDNSADLSLPYRDIPTCSTVSTKRTVAVGFPSGKILVWDLETKTRSIIQAFNDTPVDSILFTLSGNRLLASSKDHDIVLLDLDRATPQLCSLKTQNTLLTCMGLSRDGKYFSLGFSNCTVEIREANGELLRKYKHNTLVPSCIHFSPYNDSLGIVFGGKDWSISELWTWQKFIQRENKPNYLGAGQGVITLAFLDEGRTMATGGYDGTVRLWDIDVKMQYMSFHDHSSGISVLVASKDGSMLASYSWDKTICLRNGNQD